MARDRNELKELVTQLNNYMDWTDPSDDNRVRVMRGEEDSEIEDRLYEGVSVAIKEMGEGKFVKKCPPELLIFATKEGLLEEEEEEEELEEEEEEDDGYPEEEEEEEPEEEEDESEEEDDEEEEEEPEEEEDPSDEGAWNITYNPDGNQAEFLSNLFELLCDASFSSVLVIKAGNAEPEEEEEEEAPRSKKKAAKSKPVEPKHKGVGPIDKESVATRLKSGDLSTLEQRTDFIKKHKVPTKKDMNWKSARALCYCLNSYFDQLRNEED